MPKRISKPVKKIRGRKDSNQIAFATIQKTIEISESKSKGVKAAKKSAK